MLPTVQYGLYGGELNPSNLSLEHLKPHSQGGQTTLRNLALATRELNTKRGADDITKYLTPEMAKSYLAQFKDLHLKKFDGNKYIKMVTETLKGLNLNLNG